MTDTARQRVLALMTGDSRAALEPLLSEAEWSELLAVAGEALHPWLAWRLDELQPAPPLPPPVAARFQAIRRAAAFKSLVRADAFAQAIRALDAAGIPVVALKGMALAYSVYPVPWSRPMTDIDLWIEPHRLADASGCLEACGWRAPDDHVFGAGAMTKPRLYTRTDIRKKMEVHGLPESIAADPAVDGPGVWQRCERRRVAGVDVLVCGLSDQVAHLAIHLSRGHGFTHGLRKLLDLVLVARTVSSLDAWVALGQEHRSRSVAPWTSVSLELARRLLGATVPDDYFLAAGIGAVPDEIVAAACEQIWDREFGEVTGVELAVRQGRGHALGAVLARLRAYYAAPPAEGQSRLGALLSRAGWDLTGRIPRYAKMLMRGDLSATRVAYRARRLAEQDALREAVAALPVTASTPGAAPPALPPTSR